MVLNSIFIQRFFVLSKFNLPNSYINIHSCFVPFDSHFF